MRSLAFATGVIAWIIAAPSLAQEAPVASDLLFEMRDWQAVPLDATLLYRYERVSGLASERTRGFSITTYQTGSVPAWRIETQPFREDTHSSRMQGLDTLNYSFVTSERIPGRILSIDVKAVAADGRTLLQEVLSYDPSGS